MKSNAREEQLIHCLLKESSFVTVASIIEKLDISAKTAYRIIKKLNDEMETVLIETEKGKGIRLNYEAYLASRFNNKKKKDTESIYYNFSPVERRLHVIKELLFQAPLSLREDYLFSRYYLSQSAIYNDEEAIGNQLKNYDLALQKNGSRLAVVGSERNIRYALMQIMAKLNIMNFEDIHTFSGDLSQRDLRFVIGQMEFIEKEIDSLIPAPYNVNLMTHLYVLLYRAGKGGVDNSTANQIDSVQQDRYYDVAMKVTKNIEGYLCRELPISETANICAYLNGSRMEKGQENPLSYHAPSEVMELTDFYIKMFFEAMDLPFTVEVGDLNGLSSHIKPLLNRLRSKLTVKNPLLEDIKQEYSQIFAIVQEISSQAAEKFALPQIDEDENGFITLYFARYMEQNPHKSRVLIICTTGMGTSELLKTKVQRFFPEIEVIGTAATSTINSQFLLEKQPDLILTTVRTEADWGIPVVLVNTLFIERDKQNVRKALKALQEG